MHRADSQGPLDVVDGLVLGSGRRRLVQRTDPVLGQEDPVHRLLERGAVQQVGVLVRQRAGSIDRAADRDRHPALLGQPFGLDLVAAEPAIRVGGRVSAHMSSPPLTPQTWPVM